MLKKFLLTLVALLVIVVASLLIFAEDLFLMAIKPNVPFSLSRELPSPDYAKLEDWAAHPDKQDMADIAPSGLLPVGESEARADVFFIHPTSYYSAESWNAPLDHEYSRALVDYSILPNQASVFNGCCRIYAPRYRQATLYSFLGEEIAGIEALDFAYRDVLRAFDHFIESIPPGRPIILASHSQGTHHMVRLIEDRISGKPVLTRVIAIYAIGYRLPLDKVESWPDLELCASATATGCIVAWDTYLEGADANVSPRRGNYYDGGYRATIGSNVACVNPVTWSIDGEPAAQEQHVGAAVVEVSSTRLARMITVPTPNTNFINYGSLVAPRCEEGFLRIRKTGNDYLDGFMYEDGSFHILDYGLFYLDMRQNAVDRSTAFEE